MIYVFAGPSISNESIKNALPDATILPPVRAADILSLLLSETLPRPSCLLILDGYFYSTLSVRHKEIIYAMKQDIPVFGASSMGALRAAELDDYGMVGIGRIYEYYSSYPITSDDEVAILHSQSPPYQPLSIPLINIRLTLDDLVSANELSRADADTIIAEISALHFSDRSATAIDSNRTIGKLYPELSSIIVDWKYRDALLAVSILPRLLLDSKPVISQTLEDISLGTHPINFFMDSDPSRYSNDGNTGVAYMPAYPRRKAFLIDVFNSLNLMAAYHLSRLLDIQPNHALKVACHEVVVSLGPHIEGIPVNDYAETERLGARLASLLTLYSGLTDHAGLLGNQHALSDNSVFSSIFKILHSVDHALLANLISCMSGGTDTEFADLFSKCMESECE